MKNKVFISGSISIKKLTNQIIDSLDNIIDKNIEVLVGDADGIDSLVQNYLSSKNYVNVTVYSITSIPRYLANNEFNFKLIPVSSEIKKERQRQQEKDKAMTLDSEFSFVIWDSKSKGSYANLLRALEKDKKIKLYLSTSDSFIESNKIKKEEINFIYRQSNGYTASEVVEYLKNDPLSIFNKTLDLNKYLLEKKILIKENSVYSPTPKYDNLFIIEIYRGKIKGIKFRNEFIDWIEKELQKTNTRIQGSLF